MWLPAGTDYLNVSVQAGENIHNDDANPECEGHYGHGVVLELISRDSSSIESSIARCIVFISRIGINYQVESALDIVGPWTDFGDPIPGTGASIEVFDTRTDFSEYDYRVQPITP
jgi:hypothetical protein